MKRNTIKILTILVLLLVLILTGCPAQPEKPADTGVLPEGTSVTIRILHTNDIHARIREINKYGNTCTPEESANAKGIAGVARLATAISDIRENSEEKILLLDAGDWFQGSLFYSLFKGIEAQKFMNELGYNAMTFGNHEFDGGVAFLGDFLEGLQFPMVSASVDCSAEPELADYVKRYVTEEYEGHTIGIFGITTVDVPMISNPGPNLVFNDQTESAMQAVDDLEAEGADIIIMLSHSGVEKDRQIAKEVGGIDVIVGGHTHTLLSNVNENAEGPYPVMETSPDDEPVLIVQSYSWGRLLGNLEVEFDGNGVAETWNGEPIVLGQEVVQDSDVLAEVDAMAGDVDRLTALVVGNTLTNLEGAEEVCRHYESNLGNLIADAIFHETEAAGTQIAFFNGGGIRAGIPAGDVTMAAMLEVMPFTDTVATLEMKGSDVKDLLEFAVSRAENPLNEGTGRFLQVSGAEYTWDPAQPEGSRIVDVKVRNSEGTFESLDLEAVYKLATSGFLRGGGDGYAILQERAIDPYDFGRVISDVVVEYIENNSPLNYAVEGRIKRVE